MVVTSGGRPAPRAPFEPRDALDAAIDGARLASPVIEGAHGARRVLVPEGYRLEVWDDPHALPPVPSAVVEVDERESLVRYINRYRDDFSFLVADIDAGAVVAVLDWHAAPDEPRHARHRAVLQLRDSEEFKRWNEAQGHLFAQDEFAAFLEENAVDVVEPASAVLIEISRDLEATQGVIFKSSTRLESGDRAFRYETETRAVGEVRIPTEFEVEIPLYQGEPPVRIRCAFRYKVTAGGLMIGFQWRRVAYQRQAHFAALAHQVAEDTGMTAHFGRVKRGL